jgi:hypothetical protein
MDNAVLLVVTGSPELEHAIADTLLAMPQVSGFTSFPVHGHGSGGTLTIAEQVAGRRRRVRFEMMLDAEALDTCISQLRSEFGRAGLIYWAYPLSAAGRLDPPVN